MTEIDKMKAFEADLLKLTNRYAIEFDISVATILGVMHLRMDEIALDCITNIEDDDED